MLRISQTEVCVWVKEREKRENLQNEVGLDGRGLGVVVYWDDKYKSNGVFKLWKSLSDNVGEMQIRWVNVTNRMSVIQKKIAFLCH